VVPVQLYLQQDLRRLGDHRQLLIIRCGAGPAPWWTPAPRHPYRERISVYYLAAAVTVAIVCTVLNLLLTFGVIRKLREHDSLIAAAAAPGPGHSDATLPAGATVATVGATTLDGRAVSSTRADGAMLVGFFSPGCQPCEERIGDFLRYRERTGVAALAVVVDDGDTGPHVSRLSGQVDVVVEPANGAFGTAFRVTSYPALCLVDSAGVVLSGGNTFSELPDLVPA
jgi:hypothetical protein